MVNFASVTSSFRFPRPTFVYGEQVDEYEQKPKWF